MDMAFDIIPTLPDQTGFRLGGKVSASRRVYPRGVGLTSYTVQVPLVVFSAKDREEDDIPVSLADVALNLAAHVRHAVFGGGVVQMTSVESEIFDMGLDVFVRYLNVVGPVPVFSGTSSARDKQRSKSDKGIDERVRPSPSESAARYSSGERKRGNDGECYRVAEARNGTRRWIRESVSNLP